MTGRNTYGTHVNYGRQHLIGAVPSSPYISQQLLFGNNDNQSREVLEPTLCVSWGDLEHFEQAELYDIPILIQLLNSSRRWPEARIATMILRTRDKGSEAQASSNDAGGTRFNSALRGFSKMKASSASAATDLEIFLMTCWTTILMMCGKQLIRLFLASKGISRSLKSGSNFRIMAALVSRLSRVKWPVYD